MFYIRKYGLLIIFGVIIIVGTIFLNRENERKLEVSSQSEDQDEFPDDRLEESNTEESTEDPVELAVDVKGAVLDPGVYHVEEAARVYDAIEHAGGFLEKADEKQINLAERIEDEMFIYVPKEGEVDPPIPSSVDAAGSAAGADSDKIRVNNASLSELEELTGVGPSKAQAILDYIEENGPLSEVDDMLDINGIGEKTLDNFKDQLIIP